MSKDAWGRLGRWSTALFITAWVSVLVFGAFTALALVIVWPIAAHLPFGQPARRYGPSTFGRVDQHDP
jgi:hypothetical protein